MNSDRYRLEKEETLKKIKDIKVTDKSGVKDKHLTSINVNTKKSYDSDVVDASKKVEALDRFDDFDRLYIGLDKYEKKPGSIYGIPRKKMHKKYVIMDNQKAAAEAFLRERRGFGLLADVVGSGKTYEAGVVLSELAARNRIRSMLLIVPEVVLEHWKTVIEMYFGFGKDKLFRIELDSDGRINTDELHIQNVNNFQIPKRPCIITYEDFINVNDEITNYLFDVIVVDEAHHLCVDNINPSENEKNDDPMRKLSLMIQEQNKANTNFESSTYCILLTATPHSGNLDNMFRLWYFVTCNGGNPDDFTKTNLENCSPAYKSEKERYFKEVCRSATTVMEFIQNVKLQEVTANYSDELFKYLETHRPDVTKERFNTLSKGHKLEYIDEFLEDEENEELYEKVQRTIASAYHNGILRSIMIRQENKLPKTKYIHNTWFYPVRESIPNTVKIEGIDGKELTVDVNLLYSGECITVDGNKYKLNEYLKQFNDNNKVNKYQFAQIIINVLRAISNDRDKKETFFDKPDSLAFYQSELGHVDNDNASFEFYPYINHGASVKREDYYDDYFNIKYLYAINLINKFQDKKIIVFFNYRNTRRKIIERFTEAIKNDLNNKDRVLVGTKLNKKEIEKEFREARNAVLIAQDAELSESANFQTCDTIIHFEVTSDPLTMDQQIGRIFRLGQDNDVHVYNLADMACLEGYVLMYYSRIDLMASNSGDATIIAGSNSERMVAIRCKRCGRVQLLTKDDYDERLKENNVYCPTPDCVKHKEKLDEMSIYNFKCNSCGKILSRSSTEEGYMCLSTPIDGKRGGYCNSGEYQDRKMYCRKICSIAHCRKFLGEVVDKNGKPQCKALLAYKENPNVSDLDLMIVCSECNICEPNSKCRVGIGVDAISGCKKCNYASCDPKPHVLDFDSSWNAPCPSCGESKGKAKNKGILKPMLAKTFSAYIESAWTNDFDGGTGFVEGLKKESAKVAEIRKILSKDDMAKESGANE